MRLATRTFLSIFLPLTALLIGSFWALRSSVMSAVRDDLRSSVRRSQLAREAQRARDEAHSARVLGILAESAALKAGVQLLVTERQGRSREARRTVEDQLSEIAESLNFELLVVSSAEGLPLAGVMDGRAMDLEQPNIPRNGFFDSGGRLYQVASGPINLGEENLGQLTMGERFDLAQFDTAMVLLHQGKVAATSAAKLNPSSLTGCGKQAECEVTIDGEKYLSLLLEDSRDGGYELRTLQNVDRAVAPLNAGLRNVFLISGALSLGAALGISILASRSVVRPIASVVGRLKASEETGVLPEFDAKGSSISEIRELAEGFNRASVAVLGGRDQLVRAYVEFTGSLAHALDARDPYTAGHSHRVSDYACAIARNLGIEGSELDDLRIGALLHDIGKIGISDSILLKTSRLTDEEEALIRKHPVIGRRILEGVQGFHAYLNVVELHHENWDGTGYPHGLTGEATPLAARIVKVADAFDAMTSDRPYRRGMRPEDALRILERATGTQFDETVVRAFAGSAPAAYDASLRNLSLAVSETAKAPESKVLEDA